MKALTDSVKAKTRELGADLVGICSIESMELSEDGLKDLYPGAKTVIVFAYRHSSGALEATESMVRSGAVSKDSKYTRLNRYDVSHVYHSLDTIASRLTRYIEENGYASEAISGWLPVDWSEGRRGLVGDLDLRRAAVEAGLGVFGKNNLLITPEFGPRIRLGGVLTSAELVEDEKIKESLCMEGCNQCIECCPAAAIREGEKTDVQACGEQVFQFGLRSLIYYIRNQLKKPKADVLNTFVDTTLMNLWQTLCLGIYYTCSECQRVCPVGTWRKKLAGCLNPEM